MDLTLGEKIKLIRKAKNLTQDNLATKSNLSKNAIWNYENNRRIPTIDVLARISDSLEIPSSLLTINNKETSMEIINLIDLLNKATKHPKNFIEKIDTQKEILIKEMVGSAFKDFLLTIDSSYGDMDCNTLASIAQSKEFNEYLEYLYFKYKSKENY